MYKPTGHNAVSPYLLLADVEACLAFVEAVFGSETIFLARRPDGSIMHAEVRIDDSVVMMGQSADGPDSHLHVYVSDVDAAFERAKAAGGRVVQEPAEKGDGDRRGGVTDPAGTTWWLSSVVDPAARDKS